MKKIISTIVVAMVVFFVSGQQKLSYTYDGAGNRSTRTIVVAALGTSEGLEKESTKFYVDSLGGKELAIRVDHGTGPLHIIVRGYEPTSKDKYSLIDEKGKLLKKKSLSSETEILGLDALPIGNYSLHILLNCHSSIWKLVKL